ncbi:hypothetical protein AA23498_1423 [Acetobacter nitrogenifigens DSM 23921 = NBRC 105050]|uniref:Uncharacterized protein n=1 Tax=Acetobacter nitrogenifigens DSM 23921 = NBRC 105050 TaxID=1120919 RepID=A0A511XEC5_9PROT|nr:hypothetical protein AA23498_1423 [Acetobacter nitrogenifigens DSM 23921 = NBRC 105050]GEN61310.1 hypothetical protein ANI02nite_31940 [Acetobacter nitrogenifigens DSM 23921 = NBRC 105050]
MHPRDPGVYPLAQSLLQARLLCLLKGGCRAPQDEIEALRRLNLPFANYIQGIEAAWRDRDGERGPRTIGNAFEEFHTG